MDRACVDFSSSLALPAMQLNRVCQPTSRKLPGPSSKMRFGQCMTNALSPAVWRSCTRCVCPELHASCAHFSCKFSLIPPRGQFPSLMHFLLWGSLCMCGVSKMIYPNITQTFGCSVALSRPVRSVIRHVQANSTPCQCLYSM